MYDVSHYIYGLGTGIIFSVLFTINVIKPDQSSIDDQIRQCAEQIESQGSCTITDSKGNSITATEWSNWAENKVSK